MTAVPGNRPSYRWLTILLLAGAGVYTWYAISQYYRLNDLNQRQLSNASAEMKAAMTNAADTLLRFNEKLREYQQRAAAKKAGPPETTPDLCDFDRSQPYLEMRGCDGPTARSDDSRPFKDVAWVSESALEIKAVDEKGERFRLRYRADRVLQELPFPDSFELIFIATYDGTVLYQDAPPRRRWLRYLRWGEREFRDAYADRPPNLQIHNVQQLVGADGWNKLRSLSSRTTVDLGGTEHQLYLQPLVLDGSPPATLIVGGAVARATIFRDAAALGGPLLGVLVFIVLLGLLGFPFVKLASLDMRERFCVSDIKLLFVSSGALLVMFTCATLAMDGYARWQYEANGGLEDLAADLEGKFIEEVKAIEDVLSKYDRVVKTTGIADCDTWTVHTNWYAEEKRRRGHLDWPEEAHLRTVAWIDATGSQVWKTTADPVPGTLNVGGRAYFRAVRDGNLFWVNGAREHARSGDGRHAIFLAPDRSLADGKFYTFIAMASSPERIRCADTGEQREVTVLATTAQLTSVDAQPLPAGYGFAVINREGEVLYHSDRRLSLRENLYEELSDGSRARAMTYAGHRGGFDTRYRERPHRFHLHPIEVSRALERDAELPGARPASDGSDVTAHGHNGTTTNAGYYIAVFRDTSVEQALIGHVFVGGLVGPMALLFAVTALGLGILTLCAGGRHSWTNWLWPHGGLIRVYRAQTIAFVALLVASAGGAIVFDSYGPLLLLPLVAMLLGIAMYACYSRGVERAPLSNPGWQRAAVFLSLVCMVVIPTAALFRLTLSHELAKLILTERGWLSAQAEDWARSAIADARANRYANGRIEDLQNARARFVTCVPKPFYAPPPVLAVPLPQLQPPEVLQTAVTSPPSPPPRLSPIRCGPAKQLSDQPGAAHEVDAGALDLPLIGSLAGVVDVLHAIDDMLPIENEILARQLFQEHGFGYSPAGTLIERIRVSSIAPLGFTVALLLLFWWIRWNTKQVFLADLDASGTRQSDDCQQLWSGCSEDEQMVLVHIACERVANPRQRDIVQSLSAKGLLRFAPDVQPFSEDFGKFVRDKHHELADSIRAWREVNNVRSWRYARLVLAVTLGGVAFFLIATQPGLRSGVVAIATGVTGVLTAGSKLRDAISDWFARKSGS